MMNGNLIIKCPVIDEKTPETCLALDMKPLTSQEEMPPHNEDCKCFVVAVKRGKKQ